jgi:hypothetical protein
MNKFLFVSFINNARINIYFIANEKWIRRADNLSAQEHRIGIEHLIEIVNMFRLIKATPPPL